MADFAIDLDRADDFHSLKSGNIVFCKTDLLDSLWDKIQNFEGEIKLITHKSDYPISKDVFFSRPKCISKWFAQNVDFQHPDLIPIPIGIENHDGPSKGSCINPEFVEKFLPLKNPNKEQKIYCNFGDTHPNRLNIREKLRKSSQCAVAKETLSSADYHREMSNYQFAASPRGNGIDCHRTWEALLVGSFPIVERHFMYDFYTTLPIVQIDSWDEVLENGFFKKAAKEISRKRLDLSPLYMDYWREKIHGFS